MEYNERIDQDIEDYLLGKLNPSDREAFEGKLQNDPDLKKEVEFNRNYLKEFGGISYEKILVVFTRQ